MFTPNFPWQEKTYGQDLESYLDEYLFFPLKEYLARPKKEIRTQLVELGCRFAQPINKNIAALAGISIVLECLHAGSLIVDDVQDSSLERRGHPSFHTLYGVPKAINSGNWLYFWSIQKIRDLPLSDDQKSALINATIDTLFEGHIGQALDIGAQILCLPKEDIPQVCYSTMNSKTGALCGLAVFAGAIIGGLSEDKARRAFTMGREFGIILQILDDVKNLKFSARSKNDSKRFEDLRNLRPGFIWAFTAEKLPARAFEELKIAVTSLPDLSSFASWCIEYNFFAEVKSEISLKKKQLLNNYPELSQILSELILNLEKAYEKA